MNRITNSLGFKRKYSQEEVEFFDLLLDTDNEAFVSYDLIKKKSYSNSLAYEMKKSIDSYLKNLFDFSHFKKEDKLNELLSGLSETNQTSLGFSFAAPKGKSVGNVIKATLKDQIQHVMDSFRQGNFTVNSLYFGLDNIGADRTSDIIVSIIKQQLIDFTKEMVIKYNLKAKSFVVPNVYNSNSGKWQDVICELPYYKGRAIIFLPKFLISSRKFNKKVFRAFIAYAFENYIKNDSFYADLAKDSNSGLTKKAWRQFLRENNITAKEEFRKYIKKITLLINEFEIKFSDEIEFLSDDELDEIVAHAASKLN